jgi:hypothetical protein
MVDLERKRGEGGEEDKPRTGSITDASTVKITGVLGLGFIPNQHKSRKKNKKDQATYRSSADKAQEEPGRRRLAGADSITGAQVEAHIEKQNQRQKTKRHQIYKHSGVLDPTRHCHQGQLVESADIAAQVSRQRKLQCELREEERT